MRKYIALLGCFVLGATSLWSDEGANIDGQIAWGPRKSKEQPLAPLAVAPAATPETSLNPSANPKVKGWADFFVNGSYIYWKPVQEGLAYATDGFEYSNGGPSAEITKKGKKHKPHFEYAPGFKVGGGLLFRHDGWDLSVNYTRLHDKHRHSSAFTNTDKGVLFLNWREPDVTSNHLVTLDNASVHWKISYNTIDYELGRNYFISRRLSLRPHFGLKQAWIDQHYTIDAQSDASLGLVLFFPKLKQDYKALGARAGLNSAWHMANRWSIYGNMAIAALWSQFKDAYKDSSGTPLLLTADADFTMRTVKPVFELGLGLRYEVLFHNDDFRFLVEAGWEAQVWTNHNQFLTFIEEQAGDLTLQGLTVTTRFDF